MQQFLLPSNMRALTLLFPSYTRQGQLQGLGAVIHGKPFIKPAPVWKSYKLAYIESLKEPKR